MDSQKSKVIRMIDANLNRAREGLRVVEDVLRFIFDDSELSTLARQLRHQLSVDNDLLFRQSETDVGSGFDPRSDNDDIYGLIRANMRRSQEAARVLEESKKILKQDLNFQQIRFDLYELEKKIVTKLFTNA
jgi:thiamine-phosphate pyrophosphorylase